MGAEYLWLRHRAAQRGPTAGDYERRDTLASLAMGVGSLVAPLVAPTLLAPFTPGRGRYGKAVVTAALGAAAATTVADYVSRRVEDEARALTPSGNGSGACPRPASRGAPRAGRPRGAPGVVGRWGGGGGGRRRGHHHHVGVAHHP